MDSEMSVKKKFGGDGEWSTDTTANGVCAGSIPVAASTI